MKKHLFVLLAVLASGSSSLPTATRSNTTTAKPDVSRIHGKIQYVTSFSDYKVEVVASFEDLAVQEVDSLPDSPGQWQIVTSLPDFKIQKVSSFGDFKIRYVTSFPGPRPESH